MESSTASFTDAESGSGVLGNVVCDLAEVQGTIHLLGIGGIGMSALARLLLAEGRSVSGSDKSESEITDQLRALGANIQIGHHAAIVTKAKALVISTAIQPENPELLWAIEHALPIWHRSRLLAALVREKKLVAVSGTHGKTTTTGMIAEILLDCDLDPSVVIGGTFSRLGANAIAGNGDYFVAEADESDASHVDMSSYIAVLTNIEPDHLENYPRGLEQIYEAMISFANNASLASILCLDDTGCAKILPRLSGKVIGYGRLNSESKAQYQFEQLSTFSFKVWRKAETTGDLEELGEIKLNVPGEHNQYNAMAACVVGLILGLSFTQINQALLRFSGVDRRFQLIGMKQGLTIIDDYAHHPTEVEATLSAARQYMKHETKSASSTINTLNKRLVVLFQPHQPGRLRDFWEQFALAFQRADLLLLADVYVARGATLPGVNSAAFAKAVQGTACKYLPGTIDSLAEAVLPELQIGDLLITIGAGDITKIGPRVLQLWQKN